LSNSYVYYYAADSNITNEEICNDIWGEVGEDYFFQYICHLKTFNE